jgi:predicted kinase
MGSMKDTPRLYYFVGYPGAGKTTIAEIIHEQTGAVHLWADRERHKLFGQPTHSTTESAKLYEYLDKTADRLLSEGQSVIFDTNFNFLADRQLMRDIAQRHNAKPVLIWVTTPKEIAQQRAVHEMNLRNGYESSMSTEQFDRIVSKLESPTPDESPIKIDASELDRNLVIKQFCQ